MGVCLWASNRKLLYCSAGLGWGEVRVRWGGMRCGWGVRGVRVCGMKAEFKGVSCEGV